MHVFIFSTAVFISGKIASESDPTKKLALEGYELIVRFAKVLEGEGISHNYPIPKAAESKFGHEMIKLVTFQAFEWICSNARKFK